MDQGYLTGVIDLGKAFDTVDHELLLEKLREYGLEGMELVWFQDYLSNRTQVVWPGTGFFSQIPVHCPLVCRRAQVWVHFCLFYSRTCI